MAVLPHVRPNAVFTPLRSRWAAISSNVAPFADAFQVVDSVLLGIGQRQRAIHKAVVTDQVDRLEGSVNSAYHYNQLVVTCALRLPHRVRMATGNPNAARRKTNEYPGLHLWMAHSGAIWDLDTSARTSATNGSAPRRGASASTSPAGILRDDRAELARVHALSRIWYGMLDEQDNFRVMHRGATWSLRCCGDIPSSADYDGGNVTYPTCGYVLRYLLANGQQLECNSPISSYAYDI